MPSLAPADPRVAEGAILQDDVETVEHVALALAANGDLLWSTYYLETAAAMRLLQALAPRHPHPYTQKIHSA